MATAEQKAFESSVNSYDSQTKAEGGDFIDQFESSVNSYDSQTVLGIVTSRIGFESSVNSYDSQTLTDAKQERNIV